MTEQQAQTIIQNSREILIQEAHFLAELINLDRFEGRVSQASDTVRLCEILGKLADEAPDDDEDKIGGYETIAHLERNHQ
jgi:hypothetical protein